MRAATWRVLARQGVRENDRSSWTIERPAHLQALRDDPAFNAIGSAKTLAAMRAAMEGQSWEEMKNWGSAFLAFPATGDWNVPPGGWHIDANYLSALSPPDGVRTFAFYGDVVARGGGTLLLSGSHRLVHKWFIDHPPPKGTRGAKFRTMLREHPYIRDLHTDGDPDERVARFMDRAEEVGGNPLQVVETVAEAGDVYLLHPLVLHVATVNTGTVPRFLLSGGVVTPAMYHDLK